MDEEEKHTVSDEEMDDSKHTNLIEKVLSLDKVQHIKKPSRSEPTIHISEYDLVKSTTGNKESVHINALTNALKQRSSHVEIAKKLQKTEKKSKTLEKPLEKPQAERIRRSIGYTKTKQELNKWEPIVTSNRAAPHLSFPINSDFEMRYEPTTLNGRFRIKSDLQKELEKYDDKVEEYVIEPEQKFPLTLEELMDRRQESAKFRAVQSYKEAKARRQNKIKSKKFHRIQRREKMKQQIKEFELLQKTNPEEALKKLNEIEKARAEERVTLRHRSTGQWARNKQVRAKYDKESRQVLAQQLTISRDLTQKLKVDDSESEEEPVAQKKKSDESNPWVNDVKTNEEIDSFVNSYRKYWDEKNKLPVKEQTEQIAGLQNDSICQFKTNDFHNKSDSCQMNGCEEANEGEKTKAVPPQINRSMEIIDRDETKEEQIKGDFSDDNRVKINGVKSISKQKICGSKSKPKLKEKSLSTSEWVVSDLNDKSTIDNVFDILEKNLADKIQKKARSVLSNSDTQIKKTKKVRNKTKKKKIDLSMLKQNNRSVIDEKMNENTNANDSHEILNGRKGVQKMSNLEKIINGNGNNDKQSKNIDPTNVIKVKTVSLNTHLPDLLTTDDNEENTDQMAGISEAFEDDDIIEEFDKEKSEEIEKSKPQDIDLSLPGWGTWGGKDIKIPQRKHKRFILKFPKKLPRKDDNKGKLIIKEDANTKVKEHLVSEIPFPFQTVKDFEASIRAPIGNTFVPENAFRRMIKPSVITKMGTVIEPMNEEVLLNTKKFT